jgi:hypothetical protein
MRKDDDERSTERGGKRTERENEPSVGTSMPRRRPSAPVLKQMRAETYMESFQRDQWTDRSGTFEEDFSVPDAL